MKKKLVTNPPNTRGGGRCHSCEALRINGVYCHETGCPNSDWRPRVKKTKVPK
jgi:hypothetical protein